MGRAEGGVAKILDHQRMKARLLKGLRIGDGQVDDRGEAKLGRWTAWQRRQMHHAD
jgi:hypothetical protein